ncbi:MAG: bifunctional glutamate N-acetyltransferase/amino-acid acetyltransferase ArgJ [Lachnospiraceae bacterium]|jgi:glutamate N-acetyltransferase/amino-acid N-acetyltransferase|nr:bifunctional glutamate N-acetyltransferase/amino-acid acetyltransferase ArgJ [Lachnospiraceae bacterium]
MKIIEDGTLALVQGFETAAAKAAIKYQNREDMALIYSVVPCKVAGTFTSNVVKAAPVLWDRNVVETSSYVQAIVVNTGIANAGTGPEGLADTEETAFFCAQQLGIPKEAVLVASTGVIGPKLPMDRMKEGIRSLVAGKRTDRESARAASRAIMTTDTHPKQLCVETQIGGKTVHIAGMCKGSGMIHPNMGTMLSFVATDAAISRELLQQAVSADVKDTYNMISVDGDTSTNDTLLVLANGLAGNQEIVATGEDYTLFSEALHLLNQNLAMLLAGDGEGATALFEAHIIGARTKEDARMLAKSVIRSSLTKAAIFGHDANWGRFLCALGYSGADFNPDHMALYFEANGQRILIYEDGSGCAYEEEEASKLLSAPKVTVLADMKMGKASATAWGCDLSYDYVKINADYRS